MATERVDHGAEEAGRHGVARSSLWPHVEKAHLAANPYCAACGPDMTANTPVQVHHCLPFHYVVALGRPDLELDQRNLITLCETEHDRPGENHHLLIGHLDDFKSSNLTVRDDAASTYHGMTAAIIKGNTGWLLAKAHRLMPLDEMTDTDKAAFVDLMNSACPLPTATEA